MIDGNKNLVGEKKLEDIRSCIWVWREITIELR